MNDFKPMTIKPDFVIKVTHIGKDLWAAWMDGDFLEQGISATEAVNKVVKQLERDLLPKK